MRHAQETPPARDAPELLQSPPGVRQVLEHFQAHHEVVGSASNRQLTHIPLHE